MKDQTTILTINKNQSNLKLLAQFLGKNGFQTLEVSSLEEFDQALAGQKKLGWRWWTSPVLTEASGNAVSCCANKASRCSSSHQGRVPIFGKRVSTTALIVC